MEYLFHFFVSSILLMYNFQCIDPSHILLSLLLGILFVAVTKGIFFKVSSEKSMFM